MLVSSLNGAHVHDINAEEVKVGHSYCDVTPWTSVPPKTPVSGRVMEEDTSSILKGTSQNIFMFTESFPSYVDVSLYLSVMIVVIWF